jgi:hypothetical protein
MGEIHLNAYSINTSLNVNFGSSRPRDNDACNRYSAVPFMLISHLAQSHRVGTHSVSPSLARNGSNMHVPAQALHQ